MLFRELACKRVEDCFASRGEYEMEAALREAHSEFAPNAVRCAGDDRPWSITLVKAKLLGCGRGL
jgi:hypothetical protein